MTVMPLPSGPSRVSVAKATCTSVFRSLRPFLSFLPAYHFALRSFTIATMLHPRVSRVLPRSPDRSSDRTRQLVNSGSRRCRQEGSRADYAYCTLSQSPCDLSYDTLEAVIAQIEQVLACRRCSPSPAQLTTFPEHFVAIRLPWPRCSASAREPIPSLDGISTR